MSDPRKIPRDQLADMRSAVAAKYNIEDWRRYSEQQAAWHLLPPNERSKDKLADTSTLKRNRRKGGVPHVQTEGGGISYWGVQLIDYLLFGAKSCLLWGGSDEAEADMMPKPINLAPIVLGSEVTPQLTTGVGPRPDAQSVLRLAQMTLKKRSGA